MITSLFMCKTKMLLQQKNDSHQIKEMLPQWRKKLQLLLLNYMWYTNIVLGKCEPQQQRLSLISWDQFESVVKTEPCAADRKCSCIPGRRRNRCRCRDRSVSRNNPNTSASLQKSCRSGRWLAISNYLLQRRFASWSGRGRKEAEEEEK